MSTLAMLLGDLTDGYELTVRPDDGRWEAKVTRYGTEELESAVWRAKGSSPAEAMQNALMLARR